METHSITTYTGVYLELKEIVCAKVVSDARDTNYNNQNNFSFMTVVESLPHLVLL